MTSFPANVADKASWVDAKELDEHGENLSQWEIDFLESLLKQMLDGHILSARQRIKLDAIREERLP